MQLGCISSGRRTWEILSVICVLGSIDCQIHYNRYRYNCPNFRQYPKVTVQTLDTCRLINQGTPHNNIVYYSLCFIILLCILFMC